MDAADRANEYAVRVARCERDGAPRARFARIAPTNGSRAVHRTKRTRAVVRHIAATEYLTAFRDDEVREKTRIQAEQYEFPYHYLVDLDAKTLGRSLDWGLDYLSYMRKVQALVKKHLETNVLDIGCGDGYLLNQLARDPAVSGDVRLVGVDVDAKAVKFAEAFGHGVENLSFMARPVGDLEETYDLITCVETLEHIPTEDLDGFVASVDARLRHGGKIIISVPSDVRPVIKKHFRHYNLDMLRAYFPAYELIEDHYVTDRLSLLYKVVSTLLANRHFNLNFGVFKRALHGLHERFTDDVSERRGAHVVAVFRKP